MSSRSLINANGATEEGSKSDGKLLGQRTPCTCPHSRRLTSARDAAFRPLITIAMDERDSRR